MSPEPLATAESLSWGCEADAADALIAAARCGDRQAMGLIYRRYRSCVVRRLSHLAGPDGGIADALIGDMLQETFLRVMQGLPSYRGSAPFEHWVLRLATNVARSHYRAHRRSIFSLWSRPDAAPELPAPGRRADESYPELQALHRALGRLSPRLREAVILHDLEGVSLAELAAQLDVPLHTAASRVRRGREGLRRGLAALGLMEQRGGTR